MTAQLDYLVCLPPVIDPISDLIWWLRQMRPGLGGDDLEFFSSSHGMLNRMVPGERMEQARYRFAYDESDTLLEYCVGNEVVVFGQPCLKEIIADLRQVVDRYE